jgi:hypothetical protein
MEARPEEERFWDAVHGVLDTLYQVFGCTCSIFHNSAMAIYQRGTYIY